MTEETKPPQESGQTERPPDAPPDAPPAAPRRPSPEGGERPPYRQDRPPGGPSSRPGEPERRYGGDREGRPGGRPPYGGGGPRGEGGFGRRPPPRRRRRGKVCGFCVNKIIYIDYKTVDRLRHFVTDRGKILPRRITGSCARHQRMLTRAIKRARNIALIPFKAK